MGKFSNRYATDTKAEEEGQWVDFGDGIQVCIRRLTSKHSKDTRRKLEKPYAAQYRNRDMPDSLLQDLMIKQLAQSIVVDWKGVEDPADETKTLPCTQDNVLKIVTMYPDFRDDIVTASMTAATFQEEAKKDAEGN